MDSFCTVIWGKVSAGHLAFVSGKCCEVPFGLRGGNLEERQVAAIDNMYMSGFSTPACA